MCICNIYERTSRILSTIYRPEDFSEYQKGTKTEHISVRTDNSTWIVRFESWRYCSMSMYAKASFPRGDLLWTSAPEICVLNCCKPWIYFGVCVRHGRLVLLWSIPSMMMVIHFSGLDLASSKAVWSTVLCFPLHFKATGRVHPATKSRILLRDRQTAVQGTIHSSSRRRLTPANTRTLYIGWCQTWCLMKGFWGGRQEKIGVLQSRLAEKWEQTYCSTPVLATCPPVFLSTAWSPRQSIWSAASTRRKTEH